MRVTRTLRIFSLRRHLLAISGALLLLSAGATTTLGQHQPSSEPVLRIETGMHTAAIKRMALDSENRFLATVSRDKTLRIWELNTGRLVRVIRPPIGDGS